MKTTCLRKKTSLSSLVFAGLVLLATNAYATDSKMGPLSVGFILDAVTDGINEIVNLAFDRLDLILLTAAMETRATINAARLQYTDVLTTSIDEVDGQQRRIVSDLKRLSDDVDADLSGVSEEVRSGTNQVLTDIRLLLSNNPGAAFVSVAPTVADQEYLHVTVHGTALSTTKIDEFRISTVPITPEIAHMDDQRIEFRVNMDDLFASHLLQKDMTEPVEVPIAFSFIDESWWPFVSPDRRPFVATAWVLPIYLGRVRAVFATNSLEEERRPQTRGPFVSERVKARLKWNGLKYGRRADDWFASPSEGWRIDLATARYHFTRLQPGCHSGRSRASWILQTEQVLRVRARTATDRKLDATCSTETSIFFDEWRGRRVQRESISAFVEIAPGNTVVLKLAGSPDGARLSHLEIESTLFSDGRKVYRIGQLPEAFLAEYDEATQTVYFSGNYVR